MHSHHINAITLALMLAFSSVSALAEKQVNNEKVDSLPEVKVTSKAEKDQPSEKTKFSRLMD